MKLLILFVVTSLFLSCQSLNTTQRDISNTIEKPKHIIITIHGLSGNADTFGFFKDVTEKYLNQINSNYQSEVIHFVYPTGRDESKGTYQFAMGPNGLDTFINNVYKEKNLTENDKISFVCHSQGGIIAYVWYFSNLIKNTDHFQHLKQVENIITLGTPFWGSKIASILTDERNPDIIPLVKLLAPEDFKMTRREIADLAYASDNVYNLRTMAIQMDRNPAIKAKLDQMPVRMMNIIGLLPYDKNELFADHIESEKTTSTLARNMINVIYHIYKKSYMGFKNKRIENDIAVPVTSGRWNFIYSKPLIVRNQETIESDDFLDFSQLVNKSKFIFTESSHLPFETEKTLSMAYVNKNCLDANTCDHPTYRYVLEALANCKEFQMCQNSEYQQIINTFKYSNLEEYTNFKAIQKSIQSFAIQINIKLKKGTIDSWPVKYFKKTNVYPHSEDSNQIWALKNYSLIPQMIDIGTNKAGLVRNTEQTQFRIYLGDPNETKSVDVISRNFTSPRDYEDIRINLTGRVEVLNSQKKSSYVVPIKIKIPDEPEITVKTKIRPGYSTFFELDYSQKK